MSWDTRRGTYRLTRTDTAGGRRQVLLVRPADFAVVEATLEQGGKRLYRLIFDRFDRHGETTFPGRIHILSEPLDIDLRVTYREVEAGKKLDDALFRPECPGGTQRFWLDCAGGPTVLMQDEP